MIDRRRPLAGADEQVWGRQFGDSCGESWVLWCHVAPGWGRTLADMSDHNGCF